MQDIQVHQLGAFPIIQHYMEVLELPKLLQKLLPLVKGDTIHASCLCVLVENILMDAHPLYRISDWLADYTDGQAEFGYEASTYTDDRLAEALDALYKSDRHSLMSQLSSNAIKAYDLKTDFVHNDTTTVTLSGAYEVGCTQASVTPARGYNKDGRPDAKQIVFGLNTLGDGQVPISVNFYDGNVTDSETHIANWTALKELLQKTDFIYIADSKVASIENMAHIDKYNGLFISILPASRSEVRDFKNDLSLGLIEPDWVHLLTKQDSRNKNEQVTYKGYIGKQTVEGYNLHWIHSSSKAAQDAARRSHRIEKIEQALIELSPKLNRYYLKTPEQIQGAIDKILGKETSLFQVDIREVYRITETKIGRGRKGKNSIFKIGVSTSYSIEWSINQEEVKKQSRLDGLFPLVTNTDLETKQVLEHYKKQPFLEKRFCTLKSILKVAPIFLNLPHRIEAMLFLYFIALMIVALIEREVRQNMVKEEIEKLPILPQKMSTQAPTWNNIRLFFKKVHFFAQETVQNHYSFLVKGLHCWHFKLLELLKVPKSAYDIQTLNWWKFNPV